MTPDELRRLWRRHLDRATLARADHNEREALRRLRWIVRRGLLAPRKRGMTA